MERLFRNNVYPVIILISIVILTYLNTLKNPFIYEDVNNIIENESIRDISRVIVDSFPSKSSPYKPLSEYLMRPVTYLTLSINYFFSGLDPFGYHLVNILLHIAVCLMFYFFVKRIFFMIDGGASGNKAAFFACAATLFFAVHPVNTEPLNFVWKRAKILATFFYISTVMLFASSIIYAERKYTKKHIIYGLMAFVSYIMGIFSHQVALTVPAFLLIFDYVILSGNNLKKLLSRKYVHLVFWIVTVIYGLMRYYYFGTALQIGEDVNKWTPLTYLYVQPYIVLMYLWLMVVPSGQCIMHFIRYEDISFFVFAITVILIILIFFLAFLFYRGVKKYDSTLGKITLLSFAWIAVTLVPTSSIFPMGVAMTENRLYLPGIGFFVIFVVMYFILFKAWHNKKRVIALSVVMVMHILILIGFSIKRNSQYRDPACMWRESIEMYPLNYKARNNLATIYIDREDYIGAINELRKAIEINPNNDKLRYNLGVAYQNMNMINDAVREYTYSLKVNPRNSMAYKALSELYRNWKEEQKNKK